MLVCWGDPSARGAELCSDTDGNVWLWSLCHVPGCPNFVCHRKSDRFCWPHMDSRHTLAELIEDVGGVKQAEKIS